MMEVIKDKIESTSTVTAQTRGEAGLNTQVEIFGEKIKAMPSLYPENEQHIPQFLAKYCFGDFYTRKGLDLKTRELLTLCMLVSIGDTVWPATSHDALKKGDNVLITGSDNNIVLNVKKYIDKKKKEE